MAYSIRRLFLTNSDCIVSNYYDIAKSIFAYLFIQMICFFTEEEDGEGEEEDEEDAE